LPQFVCDDMYGDPVNTLAAADRVHLESMYVSTYICDPMHVTVKYVPATVEVLNDDVTGTHAPNVTYVRRLTIPEAQLPVPVTMAPGATSPDGRASDGSHDACVYHPLSGPALLPTRSPVHAPVVTFGVNAVTAFVAVWQIAYDLVCTPFNTNVGVGDHFVTL